MSAFENFWCRNECCSKFLQSEKQTGSSNIRHFLAKNFQSIPPLSLMSTIFISKTFELKHSGGILTMKKENLSNILFPDEN